MAETIWNTVVMVFHFIMKNIVIINILFISDYCIL